MTRLLQKVVSQIFAAASSGTCLSRHSERLEARQLFAVSFQPLDEYEVLRRPDDLVAGDFNSDALPDIVTQSFTDDRLTLLLNQGDGTFAGPQNIPFSNSRALAAGHFNLDGYLDLAATSTGTRERGSVSVLYGNGDGTFQPRQRFRLQNAGRFMTAADLNGDGTDDLVSAARQKVAVLLNNGDGTFARGVRYGRLNSKAAFVEVADLNADAAPDLAVATPRRNGVTVFFNNRNNAGAPTGTFSPPAVIFAGRSPVAVTSSDFNSDGNTDLAVANSGFRINGFSVLLGNGDGTFQPRQPFDARSFSRSIIPGDFDGDGTRDLIVGTAVGPYQVFTNAGGGSFTLADEVVGGNRRRGVERTVSADFNADGRADLASIVFRRSRITVRLSAPSAI